MRATLLTALAAFLSGAAGYIAENAYSWLTTGQFDWKHGLYMAAVTGGIAAYHYVLKSPWFQSLGITLPPDPPAAEARKTA